MVLLLEAAARNLGQAGRMVRRRGILLDDVVVCSEGRRRVSVLGCRRGLVCWGANLGEEEREGGLGSYGFGGTLNR